MGPLLDVEELQTEFSVGGRTIRAVNGVSFTLEEGEVLGIVGESGCGKSVTALSILRLIEQPGQIVGGQIRFKIDGQIQDLRSLSAVELRQVRGNLISMIFQDPMTSLNPVLSIGYQLMEPLRVHRHLPEREARQEAARLLERVGIPEAESRLRDFPHQFSGGMRQRVMIAMAIACRPRLLIADEPTTALDVTTQAQILDLIHELKEELGSSIIIITHDLGVIAEVADRVAVMYAGRIVEHGSVNEIFTAAQHPYTRALLFSIPRLQTWPSRLPTIEGAPPNLSEEIAGCPFEPRCRDRIPICRIQRPELRELTPGHAVACFVAQAGGLKDV